MSYIHQALKKAQQERNADQKKYDRILSAGEKERRLFRKDRVWWILLGFLVIFLAFASYSWLDSKNQRIIETDVNDNKGHAAYGKTGHVQGPKQYFEEGRLYHKRGSLKHAERLYRKALSIDPGYVEALNNLGIIHIYNKDLPAARGCFEKAARLRPLGVDAYYNLACVSAIQDDPAGGISHLKKAVSLDPSAREWAREDADLENLRGLPEFKEITGDNNQ